MTKLAVIKFVLFWWLQAVHFIPRLACLLLTLPIALGYYLIYWKTMPERVMDRIPLLGWYCEWANSHFWWVETLGMED